MNKITASFTLEEVEALLNLLHGRGEFVGPYYELLGALHDAQTNTETEEE